MNKAEWDKMTSTERAMWGRAFKSGWEAGQLEVKKSDKSTRMENIWILVIVFLIGLAVGPLVWLTLFCGVAQ